MKQPEVLYPSSGQKLESQEKPLSPEYLPLKSKPSSEQEIQTDLSTSGLESLTPKKNLGRGKKRSSQDRPSSLPVPKPLVKPVDRTQQALKRLGVDLEKLRSSPEITPMLKNAAGGLKAVLGAMRFSADDPVVDSFLQKYDSIPVGDREKLSWEAIALAAELDLRVFLGSAMLALQAHAVSMVKIIAMTNHPKITKARVRYGLLPSGEKDRTALDTAMRFLPSPKGPTFIGKAVFGAGNQTMSAQGAGRGEDEDGPVIDGDDDPDLNDLFPSSNTIQQRMIPIRQRILEDGK
jgi:hypothetical protein